MDNREAKWRKYKADFLRVNRCTADEFEQAYIAFMESKPNDKAYRQFARRWNFTIHPEPRLPEHLQVVFSVNISAMKVMAETFEESESAFQELVESCFPRH